MTLARLVALALAIALVGCDGVIGAFPLTDGGSDAGLDAGSDAGTDAGVDAGTDGGVTCVPPFAGSGTVIASNLSYPRHLAIANGELYVTEIGTFNKPKGKVDMIDLSTGLVTTLFSGLQGPDAVAADGTSVYWSDSSGLWKYDFTNPQSTIDTKVNGAIQGTTDLAWAGSQLVYATGSRFLELVDPQAGTHQTLFSGDAGSVVSAAAVDGQTAYFLVSGTDPNPGLYQVGLSGTPAPSQVLAEPTDGTSIALTPDAFFWATGRAGSGAVRTVPRSGGTPVDLAAGLLGPRSVLPVQGFTYFQDSTAGSDGGTSFLQVAGGCLQAPIPVGPAGQGPGSIVLSPDGGTLYFTSFGGTGQGFVGAL